MTLIATILTASYTLRIVYLTQIKNPRFQPIQSPDENTTSIKNALLRLTLGSIITGLLLAQTIYTKTQTITIPHSIKLAALLVTIAGLILANDIINKTTTLMLSKKHTPINFSTQLGFFNNIVHRTIPNISLKLSQKTATQTIDQI